MSKITALALRNTKLLNLIAKAVVKVSNGVVFVLHALFLT